MAPVFSQLDQVGVNLEQAAGRDLAQGALVEAAPDTFYFCKVPGSDSQPAFIQVVARNRRHPCFAQMLR